MIIRQIGGNLFKYIVANWDIGHLNIVTEGYSETDPIALNEEKEGPR